MNKFSFSILIFLLFLSSCSKDEKEVSLIKETRQDLEMLSTYDEAYEALERGDPYFAAKKFLEAELLFPQSDWAPRSALMASYAYYMQNYYAEALDNLDVCKFDFLKWQPNPSKTSAWALGMRRFTIRADTFFRQTSAAKCMQKLGQRFSRVRPSPGKLKIVVFFFILCANHSKHEAKHSFF